LWTWENEILDKTIKNLYLLVCSVSVYGLKIKNKKISEVGSFVGGLF